jgi:hypothetical protein
VKRSGIWVQVLARLFGFDIHFFLFKGWGCLHSCKVYMGGVLHKVFRMDGRARGNRVRGEYRNVMYCIYIEHQDYESILHHFANHGREN